MNQRELSLEEIKQAILQRRVRERMAGQAGAAVSVPAADRGQPLPLSWAQQRLWFLAQLDPTASTAYHLPAALRLRGALDLAALRATLDRLAARHESLRTTFVQHDGAPVQAIAAADCGFALRLHDLRALPADQRDAAVAALGADEAARPFDLAAGPLARALLLQLADDEHVLLLTQHHIISDGWSVGVMVREVSALYAAFSQGLPDPLPALAIQYADYAAWQRQRLGDAALQGQADWWRAHLDGAPALLALPADRPRPALHSHAGAGIALTIPAPLAAGLRALAARHGATLFMTLLAGWAALLSRLSGQDDVVVGTPVANRQHAGLEGLIGCFVNTLALRVRLQDNPSVASLLAAVRADTLAAYEHQDLPFEQVVEAVNPPRSRSHSPLFQVMLSLNNSSGANAALSLPGLTLAPVELPHSTAQFDLSLNLGDNGHTLGGHLEYATALFERDSVERLAGYWLTLLAAMVADDRQRVAALPLLDPQQRQQVLVGFNDTARAYPPARLLHQLFEDQAAARPDAVALEYGGERLGYAELNRRANQLAHRLLAMGVGPDQRVALCLERGVPMIVGVLGVLKAGAAYVPLDPAYPAERLAYMLDDSAPKAVLSLTALQARLPAGAGAARPPLLLLDADAGLAGQPTHNPCPPGLHARHLAYVIYTSGSTGQPKGVMIEHANAVNFIHWALEQFSPQQLAHTLFSTSINFDLHVFELFAPLACGATIHLVRDILAPAPAVTLINTVPSAISALLDAGRVPAAMRSLNLAGEPLKRALVERLFAETGVEQVANLYGPSETTTYSTWVPMARRSGFAAHIGRPVANTTLYVLDAQRQPVPIGVAGELYIGGAGVARGYLNRPELSAERFIADPFSGRAGERLYRTGDLVRWLADGCVEYLGRNDFQVKLRGFRIEPGEIEACLAGCAGVREAVVIAREDQPGERRLVAYLVAEAGTPSEPAAALDPAALRAALATRLADYMLPAAYVVLAALPLTPNGKLDRSALPAPDRDAVAARRYQAPQGPAETALAALWAELLGLEQVGRDDHFFELGGHSLMVITLIERLRRLGLSTEVRAVFDAPTLQAMAAGLAAGDAAPRAAPVPPNLIGAECDALRPELLPLVALTQHEIDLIVDGVPGGAANIQDIYPLAPLQEGILFHHLLGGEGDAYLMRSVLAFDQRARLDAFLDALQSVIARHAILRSSVHWDGLATPVQVVQRRAPLPVHALTLEAGADAMAQLQQHTDPRRLRLDLRRAPLIAAYVAADPRTGEWLLALLNHHLVSDHLTLELIIAEIQALLQGRGDSLPPSLPYRDFIAQARAMPAAAHEEYFRRRLADIDAPTAPFGLLDVRHDGGRVGEARLELDAALARRVREGARRHGVSAAVLFHTAWAQVLAQCCGRDDVVFGTVLSGRMQGADGAGQVLGMFINTLPLRISLGARAIGQVVADCQRDLSELLAHEQASLALAQRCSGVAGTLPLFTTLLNYRHSRPAGMAPGAAAPLEGMRAVAGEERTNYPVTVSVDDFGDGFGVTAQCADGIDARRIAAYLLTAVEALGAALAQHPEQPAHALSILPPDERLQLLETFNDSAADYPRHVLIHQLFEHSAAAHPDAAAVLCDGDTLSYGQLNRRANELAHQLLARGVRPDDRVAVCLERGCDMVASLLAILKAGAAYVPLDPAYPAARLAYMLADSAPVALVTTRALLAALTPAVRAMDGAPAALLLDAPAEAAQAGAGAERNPDPAALGLAPHHLAYVIYTSGSTGQPKGVMIAHANAVNFIHWAGAHFPPRQLALTLFSTSINFDLHVFELFVPLACGATVKLVRDVLDAPEAVSLINTVPSALSALLAARRVPASVESVNLAGEPLTRALAERLFAETGVLRLANLYGPSETTTYSTWVRMERHTGFVPHIGRPVANTRLYVLDAHRQLAPLGVAGELYIGGAGVARGYLNQPLLTAQRFLADPFSGAPEARLYRTGDLVRWLPDGNLEYLGRNDFQVKIRGFRIELGEIETRLAACAGVREAVVLARQDGVGEARLVAYVLAAAEAPTPAALRAALAQHLAEHMLPAAYVMLAAWPLTPNGKLDRNALPAPDQDAVTASAYAAPRGATEQALAGLWQELLGLPQVGRHDHFFELGGHSLLAVQLTARLRSRLGVELGLRALFAQPTLAALAELVDQARGAGAAADSPAIAAADRAGPLPLSWAQQRLWFLDQLDPAAGAAYHMPAALRLSGTLDQAALQACLDRVVARHEGLRTRFAGGADGPRQHIAAPDCGFALATHDLRQLAGQASDDAVARLGAQEAARPFDLAAGPLVRGQLLRLAEDEHLLLLTQHHIVTDAWSVGILVGEVNALYTAFSQGRPDPLPPLALQYADYAAWQRQWLQGAALRRQADFWRGYLDGAPALLALPLDRPRPALQQYAGASVALTIPADLAAGLRRLSQRHGATLFMTLLTGWAMLMARLSGQDDIVVGTPVANRQRPELEGLIGLFLNTLALRVRLDGNPSVAALLARVRDSSLAAYSHQDLPFDQVVEAVQPPRSLAHGPLFQVMLNLMNTPGDGALALPGLSLRQQSRAPDTTHDDLSLSLVDSGDAISGSLNYASALFEHGTAERIGHRFLRLLAAMVADAEQPAGDIALLDPDERQLLLAGFNATARAWDAPATLIHQLFEAQAASRPDAVALLCDGVGVGYGELNARANRLAHRLLALGVRADDRVALCAERSPELVVGLLAILKAGAAYVPLDPAYPAARLAHMLRDCAPVALLAQDGLQALLEAIAVPATLPVLALAGDDGPPDADHNPAPATQAAQLAYVIYTSGSTGLPKGVAVEHGNVLNLVRHHIDSCALRADDRVLQFASFSFDSSIEELFPVLAVGATVVLRPADMVAPSPAYIAFLDQHRITVADLPTAFWHQWMLESQAGLAPPSAALRLVIIGGEKAERRHLDSWLACARLRRCELLNTYGPTETTVYATAQRFGPCAPAPAAGVPIGRPIANTQAYLLDARGQPVPLGVVGELYLGGAGVARGYLNLPALSAERFIDDPFGGRPGARLYRTGDLARWLPNGDLDYQGRNDFQVKLRGFRIELGEIEAHLAACDGVREALVVLREERLVAYLLGDGAAAPDAAALRRQLAATLAEHMLPSAFVTLPAFPLTPSGKLDRQALPAPGQDTFATGGYEEALGATEVALAAVWAEVLKLDRVGRHDDFFALGGHSLLAAKLMSLIEMRLRRKVPLQRIFSCPTVHLLAGAIDQHQALPGASMPLEHALLRAVPAVDNAAAPAAADVLLTGANGFVGAFLLRELLASRPEATIYCLVRAATAPAAARRLQQALADYGLWRPCYAERIVALAGDLTAPELGLDHATQRLLEQRVGLVVHNGAAVNHAQPYRALRAANVEATLFLLQLAARAGAARFAYISTTATFAPAPRRATVDEQTCNLDERHVEHAGYAASKWQAEVLVERARQQGMAASIFRLGRVVADSVHGKGRDDDMVARYLRTCLALGIYLDTPYNETVIPVDAVAAAVCRLCTPASASGNYHLLGQQVFDWNQLMDWARQNDAALRPVPLGSWYAEALRASAENSALPFAPYLHLFDPAAGAAVAAEAALDQQATCRALAELDYEVPVMTAPVLLKYLDGIAGGGV
ncbi:non-ribosomal peptide synthetase [Duganella violaceipulchra]|uniref:Amino acid adenylation domain-containing protein n=1 Tax=Duganella violaceipulchra TaxID=2849652 RepID=A0AA41HFZ7_9BURK|nr:non-ribosomal peptide synthetase [Duganella violaceicalia]MBV6325445.1 amino acid adenylation domain-containing protein [Duganella violaceicalia]MCP2012534.1 amino acid adenylation domain-containing protein/thioester reductase-like protein [Duganella violaceicalia]